MVILITLRRRDAKPNGEVRLSKIAQFGAVVVPYYEKGPGNVQSGAKFVHAQPALRSWWDGCEQSVHEAPPDKKGPASQWSGA
jgi:hypothetical protein